MEDRGLDDLPFYYPPTDANPGAPKPRCRRHQWQSQLLIAGAIGSGLQCLRCGRVQDPTVARRGKNNRSRGNKEELTVARTVGGRKVGPLGHPWDVEMPGYARLQVRKYATPQGLRAIARELARIGSGAEMAGYVWVEPGRGGEALIVFRLKDFAERHGIPEVGA
jgi:hypothetical protein